eukprot:m.140659 g.140659  ORF g.140659 m.140659 type:complete len:312 (-) comp16109_c0_seq2:1713-2648(-)
MSILKAVTLISRTARAAPLRSACYASGLKRLTTAWPRCYSDHSKTSEPSPAKPETVATKAQAQVADGVVHIALSLPSVGQTQFTLLPGLSLGHLIRDIKDEDDEVSVVKATGKDGIALAQSTLLQQALVQPFSLQVNDTVHSFSPVTAWPKPGSQDASALIDRLAMSVQVLEAEQHRRQQLRDLLAQTQAELEPMEAARVACEASANAAARRQAWLGFAWLGFGFGFLGRLTWVDYSWDLMEPVTYFVGLTANLCVFAYYLLTQRDHSMEVRRERIELDKFHSVASKHNLDVELYNKLKAQMASYKSQLRQ